MFQKISGIEVNYSEDGNIMIFCEKSFSHSAKKFRRGTFLCFTNFLIAKKFTDKEKGGKKYQNFLSSLFGVTVPIISRRNPLVFH